MWPSEITFGYCPAGSSKPIARILYQTGPPRSIRVMPLGPKSCRSDGTLDAKRPISRAKSPMSFLHPTPIRIGMNRHFRYHEWAKSRFLEVFAMRYACIVVLTLALLWVPTFLPAAAVPPEAFIIGADISWVQQQEADG